MPKKQSIINAAQEVFSQKGFFLATVDEICEKAKVGKGTVYNYFSTKEDLFYALIETRQEELTQALESVVKKSLGAGEKLKEAMWIHLDLVRQYHDLWHLMVSELPKVQNEDSQKRREYFRKRLLDVTSKYEKIISQGEEEGIFIEGRGRLASRAIFHLVTMHIFPQNANVEQVVNDITQLISYGIHSKD